ncbi:MAG: alpha/beta hydrolase [Bacteroidota bacterium]
MQVESIQAKGLAYLNTANPSSSLPPIILVHGAYHDGTVWEDNFMKYFYVKGHDVNAIHLKDPERVHKISTLFAYRLKDYVDKLDKLVSKMDRPPILIGHSMGGLVIQRFVSETSHQIHGLCLLASLPPFGLKHTFGYMLRHPLVMLAYTSLTLNPSFAQKYPPPVEILSKRVSKDQRKKFGTHIVRESSLALFDCFFPNINTDQVKKIPMVIFGATLDNLALAKDVKKTGEIYGVEPRIFEGAGHALMMEPEWEDIAEEIHEKLV